MALDVTTKLIFFVLGDVSSSCCRWPGRCQQNITVIAIGRWYADQPESMLAALISRSIACKEWPTHKFPDVQLSIEFSQDSRSAEPPSIILKQELAGLKLKLLALIWTSGGVSNTSCFHFHLLTHSTPYLGYESISTITLSSLGKPNRVVHRNPGEVASVHQQRLW